jgi:hypothetical protein
MATPNYAFEKRKKEMAKKQKQQQKQQQKQATQNERSRDDVSPPLTSKTPDSNN